MIRWLGLLSTFGVAVFLLLPRGSSEIIFKPRPAAELEQLMLGAFVAARPAMLQLRSLRVSSDTTSIYSQTGRASGFLISDDGYALTAYHAVIGIDRLEVLTTKQELLPARVIGFDESRDLALIQVLAKRRLEFLALETEAQAKINDPIVEIGNSGNDFIQPRYGVVQGYLQNNELLIPTRLMLSDVPISPGDSGGAVVNFAGRAIGIGIGYAQSTTSRVSYLVPFFGLQSWIKQLQAGAKLLLPGIGLRVAQNQEFQGVDVDYIRPDSPAAQAGMRTDPSRPLRLLEIDGQIIETLRDYNRLVRRKKIGERIVVKFTQQNRSQTLTLRTQ